MTDTSSTQHAFNPEAMAAVYRGVVREEVAGIKAPINVVGFLVSDDPASETYAKYTEDGCRDVGVNFSLARKKKEEISAAVEAANKDANVHGIFVYYPIFGDKRDHQIKDSVDPRKDVEGLTAYWMKKLYANERFDDAQNKKKSILPCTPLAIIKMLEATDAYSAGGLPFQGQTITIFNRSDVVGRPLAYMLANDGGTIFSFDISGGLVIDQRNKDAADKDKKLIDRKTALAQSDIVITGIPSRDFEKIRAEELKAGAICLNFSFVKNFEDAAREAARLYIPRVGPLTVAMCLRNAVRLYRNYHQR